MAPSPLRRFYSYLLLSLLFTLSGCLPFSCQPAQPRALFPADSLSRQYAETTSIDTLSTLWETRGGSDIQLVYPRTVRFDSSGTIYASDAQNNEVYRILREDGSVDRVYTSISYETPYLVGIREDTLLVFNPANRRIDYTIEDETQLFVQLPPDETGPERLQYVVVSGNETYYKVLEPDTPGYLMQLGRDGQVKSKTPIPEPYWRYAGALRMWEDEVLSLSAYRPFIDFINENDSLDSLSLFGFDSPMLARSRAFVMGNTRQPPLLYSSAAPLNDLLFVLNLRPGWLRIDVFNREGRLQHRLVQQEPGFNKEFYPIDIDARNSGEGEIELLVAYIKPEPKISLYSWKPES